MMNFILSARGTVLRYTTMQPHWTGRIVRWLHTSSASPLHDVT